MKFFTNRIPTNSKSSFSDLVEKVAAAQKQIKTASAAVEAEPKVAETTEPANDDNEMRHDVHGPEGSPADQNGEPEKDGEQKVVKAQLARPMPTPAKPLGQPQRPMAPKPMAPVGQPQRPMAPAPVAPLAKPAVPGIPGMAPKPMAPAPLPTSSAPGMAPKPAAPGMNPGMAPKPAAPGMNPGMAPKPTVPGSPTAPAATQSAKGLPPTAAKPMGNTTRPTVPGAKPVPAAPRPTPTLAASTDEVVVAANADCGCETKVAEGQAAQDNGSEGETKNTGKFPEPDREQMYKQEPQEDGKAQTEKEAAATPEFTRIANLTPKAKSWLKKYWSMLYPSDYADAMTQDK